MGLFLASASPRRMDILEKAGVPFTAVPADVDETRHPSESPRDFVLRMAVSKAMKVFGQVSRAHPGALVLGADTAVVLEGMVLGKPRDQDEARAMLSLLSGKGHLVLTGYAVKSKDQLRTGVAETLVLFRELTGREIDLYAASGEPMDKAGAYAIQGDYGPILVDRVEGSYSNVVGLPLGEVLALISELSGAGVGN